MCGAPRYHALPIYEPPKRRVLPPERVFDGSLGDFWNDPKRWDGIDDPHKQMCWMPKPSIQPAASSTYPTAHVHSAEGSAAAANP